MNCETCWAKAAQCAEHAADATDLDVREFFFRLRDSWIRTANRQQIIEDFDKAFQVVHSEVPMSPIL